MEHGSGQMGSLSLLPLGVFAVTQDGQSSGPPPPTFLQLTVSKEGVIAGTVTNTETDNVQAIEGMVDKKTQRSAWVVEGKDSPIFGNRYR